MSKDFKISYYIHKLRFLPMIFLKYKFIEKYYICVTFFQFDTSATAVILTTNTHKVRNQSLAFSLNVLCTITNLLTPTTFMSLMAYYDIIS